MNRKPLVERLNEFVKAKNTSLHVPGHKNGELTGLPNVLKQAMQYDVTELAGLDDLHYPEDVILQAEQLLAKAYHTRKSFFLVNGSTVGNLAMIYASCKRDDYILVQRNAHKSIFHAVELTGVKPIFIAPQWDELTQTAGHITLASVQEAVHTYKNIRAIVITNPTYYGVVAQELKHIIAYCHMNHIIVLVDEAHGAHFSDIANMPKSSLSLGADIVVQSAHKTLPAMTMASYLHVNSERVNVALVKHYLQMLQSSSPSYLLMASLDDARHYYENYRQEDLGYFLAMRADWLESLRAIIGVTVITVDDPLKLLLRVEGFSGFQVQHALEQQGIYAELADVQQVLLVLPLLKKDMAYDFAQLSMKIAHAVESLQQPMSLSVLTEFAMPQIVELNYSADEVAQLPHKWVPYTRAIDFVAAKTITPYPPGIPLLIAGEKITVTKLAQLEQLQLAGASFQGEHRLAERLIAVLDIEDEEK